MYYVYVLKGDLSQRIYVGYTQDLRKRIAEHEAGKNYSSSRMKMRELVYYEAYKSKDDAKRREKALKHHGSAINHLKKRMKESLR